MQEGGFLICGYTDHPQFHWYQVGWLLRINANGDSLWYREYAYLQLNEAFNTLKAVDLTNDKGFVASGTLFAGTQDIWVIKTDSIGCLVPNCDGVSITEFNPAAGAQMLIYPNPFNEAFAIKYFIPAENKEAVFQLYDIYGKLVYQTGLTKEVRQLQVVASSLKAGMYIASLVVDRVVVCSEKVIKE
jgi:hypothetical protein